MTENEIQVKSYRLEKSLNCGILLPLMGYFTTPEVFKSGLQLFDLLTGWAALQNHGL